MSLQQNAEQTKPWLPEALNQRIRDWRESLRGSLRDILRAKLDHRETKELVLEMLRQDGLTVESVAGPREEGANTLCKVEMPYGMSTKMAVQVKMHWEEDHDTTGIEQLEHAFSAYGVSAGLLVTMADRLSEDLERRIEESRKKYNIRVLFGEELYTQLLGFAGAPDISEMPGAA